MRHNQYLKYLFLQVLMIPTIISIFKYIPDRKSAALLAGSLFISLCIGTFRTEYLRLRFHAKIFWFGGLQFFLLFALPILLLRLTHWNQAFGEIEVGPIRAVTLHEYSNKSYLLWMLATAIESVRWMIIKRRSL